MIVLRYLELYLQQIHENTQQIEPTEFEHTAGCVFVCVGEFHINWRLL